MCTVFSGICNKSGKLSSIAYLAKFLGHITDNSSGKSVLRNLFMKSVGERSMEIQEDIHQVLSLKLYNSSFNFQTKSLENSRVYEMTFDGIKCEISFAYLCITR